MFIYIKKYKLLLMLIFILVFSTSIFIFTKSTNSATNNCCYHECNIGDGPKCVGNRIFSCCNDCDDDPYQDWCAPDCIDPDGLDCSLTGQVCQDGQCIGASNNNCTPSLTCSSYSGQCGTSLWDGCSNALNCVNNCGIGSICCNSSCQSVTCTQNSNCNDSNSCTSDVCINANTCNAQCQNNSITACADDDNCCPNGCTNSNDNNCTATCSENWTCTVWSTCVSGSQTRTCTDQNGCGTILNIPSESQACSNTNVYLDECNGVCQSGYTSNEDPDCGCVDDDGCCGETSCDLGNDNDCFPTTWDWSHQELPNAGPLGNDDWMSPVRNQGQCGSCWAFSLVAAMEGLYNIEQNDPGLDINLSESYLVSDCYTYGDCSGGSFYNADNYVINNGIPYETCMPYTGAELNCSSRCAGYADQLWRIEGSTRNIDGSFIVRLTNNPKFIKKALYEYGPILSRIVANDPSCSFANNIYQCSVNNGVNHAVLIVGYNDIDHYWIIKNSWGASWNGNGYYRVGYNANTGVEDNALRIYNVNAP